MSDAVGKHVYTSDGDYFGQIEEVNLADNRIDGWKIKISGGFMNVLGGAKGVIIPQQFVKAIGDIFIVNKTSLPMRDEGLEMPAEISEAGESSSGFESF